MKLFLIIMVCIYLLFAFVSWNAMWFVGSLGARLAYLIITGALFILVKFWKEWI